MNKPTTQDKDYLTIGNTVDNSESGGRVLSSHYHTELLAGTWMEYADAFHQGLIALGFVVTKEELA